MKNKTMFWLAASLAVASGFQAGPPPQVPDGKIHFVNASFEGKPGESKIPPGWSATTPGSTPDLMPGAWGLACPAFDGQTCLGLVTREDGTREDLGQWLSEPLKGGTCYTFSMYLCHAERYVGYNMPARVRIWGGAARGQKTVLLNSSPLVDWADWREVKFQFAPPSDVRYITFEAYFAPGAMFYYKGNVLIDNCSPIERCDRA
ncbi:MAG: hypothetical protein ACK4Q5_07845 [Saprospiraceae bacterium]